MTKTDAAVGGSQDIRNNTCSLQELLFILKKKMGNVNTKSPPNLKDETRTDHIKEFHKFIHEFIKPSFVL